jgi:hypothetical protein
MSARQAIDLDGARQAIALAASRRAADQTAARIVVDVIDQDSGAAGGGDEGVQPVHTRVSPVAGLLTLPDTGAVFVDLDGPVAQIAFPAIAGDRRIVVYFRQDATGGHAVAGWPPGLEWAERQAPVLTLAPLGRDVLIFDVIDGGALILGNVVGLGYGPI